MKWLYLTLIFSLLFIVVNAQKKAIAVTPKNDQIINDPNSVEEKPSFPGGKKAFYKFLGKNLKWPLDDETYVQGRVLISFVVESDGRLTNFKVEKKLWPELDSEALRVLKKSPKWIPGKQNGKLVRVRYTVPINFTITD